MTKFKTYTKYKNSGVIWIEEIPERWNIEPIRSVLNFRNEKNDPIETEQILSLSIANGVTLYSHEGRGGNKSKSDLKAYKIARKGDIVINSMNVIVGAVGLSKYTGAISPVYYAMYGNNKDINIRFYEYIFKNRAFQRYLLTYGKGILIKRSSTGKLNTIRMKVSRNDLKTTNIPSPPIHTQNKIANYLDYKMNQINSYIYNLQEQITLLTENRQKLIHEAITSGISDNGQIRSFDESFSDWKNTDITWTTKIPKHWNVRKLKYVFRVKKNISGELGFKILSITQSGIKVKDISTNKGQISSDYSKYQLVNKGDFAMNHMDLLTGYVDISRYDGVTSPDYRVFELVDNKCEPEYLLFILQTCYHERLFYHLGRGASKMGRWRLGIDAFNDFLLPIPSLEEQNEIINFLKANLPDIDKQIKKIRDQIQLIKEYKDSLISKVVTGKINVEDIKINISED